jgi:hypothetical protein
MKAAAVIAKVREEIALGSIDKSQTVEFQKALADIHTRVGLLSVIELQEICAKQCNVHSRLGIQFGPGMAYAWLTKHF